MKYELPDDILREKRSAGEFRLHVACVDYLKGQIRHGKNTYPAKRPFPQLFDSHGNQRFTHIFQGRGDAKEGFFNKMLGLRTGLLDIFIWPGFFGFIDLKLPGEKLSEPQEQFAADMRSMGVKIATASKVIELRNTLMGWGMECSNMICHEPPMSLAEQQKIHLDMMSPL